MPASEQRLIAQELRFPEGSVPLTDGSVLLIEIEAGRLTRVGLDGTKRSVAALVMRKSIRVAAPITYINDIHGIGLDLAQGLLLTETFYWDLNDRTRAFTKRVQPSFGEAKPSPEQAGAYSGVLHYLKVAAAMGPAQAKASGRAAMTAIKATPTDDDAFGHGRIREDGQKLHPAYLFEDKALAKAAIPGITTSSSRPRRSKRRSGR